jgi:hypothetical protein
MDFKHLKSKQKNIKWNVEKVQRTIYNSAINVTSNRVPDDGVHDAPKRVRLRADK